jgi:hypothetical protein
MTMTQVSSQHPFTEWGIRNERSPPIRPTKTKTLAGYSFQATKSKRTGGEAAALAAAKEEESASFNPLIHVGFRV